MSTPNPSSHYGAFKLCTEHAAKAYWLAHSIARPAKRKRQWPTKHPSAHSAKMKKAANWPPKRAAQESANAAGDFF
jgi:dTDP-4-dehydrorhamnose reductase